MRGRLVRRGAAMMAALGVGLVGAVGVVPTVADADPGDASLLSAPGMTVSLPQAGELALWGDNTYGQATVPASLAGVAVSQVVLPDRAVLALTADGLVVGWGANPERLERVPAEVAAAKVAQIATQGFYAGALTRDGRVLTWGAKRSYATPLDVPQGLSGVKQLALSEGAGAALKADGSVVTWGRVGRGQLEPPAGLKASVIAGVDDGFLALTEEGTVVGWGGAYSVAPLLEPGNVAAIATGRSNDVLALLADHTLIAFSASNGEVTEVPAEVAAADPVLLAGPGFGDFAIVDQDRTIRYWSTNGAGLPPFGEVPAALNGRAVVQIELGSHLATDNLVKTGAVIITKLLRAELPQVTGAAKVGSVLTGVPGTFSAAPDSVASQWLVDGVPVAGSGSQLSVTAAMVGKKISYQSTATKAGETTISSTSAAVTAEAAPVVKVVSKTKVAKVTVAKKAANVVVTGKVTASKSPAGKAKVTIKKGKKTIVATNVNVSAKGALKLTVKKFAKLVAKKLKAKGKKAKAAYRGKYSVTISYAGNTLVKASTGSGKFTIKK